MVALHALGFLTALVFSTTNGAFVVTAPRRSVGVCHRHAPARTRCLQGRRRIAALGMAQANAANGAALPGDALQLRGGAAGFATSIDGTGTGKGTGTGEGEGEDTSTAEGKTKRGLPGLWRRYLDSLERRPLLTKAVSAGVIDGTANLIEQTMSSTPFSWVGWIAFTLVGGVFIGPALHFWYNALERVNNSKRLTARVPSKWGRVLVQVALDQSLGASIMNCSYFTMHTIFLAALTGNLFPLPELGSSIVDKVSSRYVTMIINNAKLWPGVGLLNFGLVPKNLRVLVTNFVAVFWGYLMSKWVK